MFASYAEHRSVCNRYFPSAFEITRKKVEFARRDAVTRLTVSPAGPTRVFNYTVHFLFVLTSLSLQARSATNLLCIINTFDLVLCVHTRISAVCESPDRLYIFQFIISLLPLLQNRPWWCVMYNSVHRWRVFESPLKVVWFLFDQAQVMSRQYNRELCYTHTMRK